MLTGYNSDCNDSALFCFQDEKNSLQDLGTECQRSLSKVDSDNIAATLQASDEILSKLVNTTQNMCLI